MGMRAEWLAGWTDRRSDGWMHEAMDSWTDVDTSMLGIKATSGKYQEKHLVNTAYSCFLELVFLPGKKGLLNKRKPRANVPRRSPGADIWWIATVHWVYF